MQMVDPWTELVTIFCVNIKHAVLLNWKKHCSVDEAQQIVLIYLQFRVAVIKFTSTSVYLNM